MLTALHFNSFKKLNKVMNLLKKAGRNCFYDKFYDDVCSVSYILWYRTI